MAAEADQGVKFNQGAGWHKDALKFVRDSGGDPS